MGDMVMKSLEGVWGAERALGPEMRGTLRITQEGDKWRAAIGGMAASGGVEGDSLLFSFGESKGELRVPRVRGGPTGDGFNGHWVQPPRIADGSRYATRVELRQVEHGEWTGDVNPLDDRLEIYLVILEQPDGSLSAFFRDPQANVGVFFPVGSVQINGDSVRLVRRGNDKEYIEGTYDGNRDSLGFRLPFYPLDLEFTRRGGPDAPGFYPRADLSGPYAYEKPIDQNDGWETAGLAEVGFDEEPVYALVEQILGTETTGLATPYIQGLLIARHGKLVLEEYFYGFSKDRPHDLRSAGKSLSTMLVGLAIDGGADLEVTTPVYSVFPEYLQFANDSAQKRKITVEHLMTMSSGLECDDQDEESAGNEDNMQSQQEQPDWYKFALDLPSVREPGEKAVYCTAGMNLLGGVISNATGEWLPEFFRARVAGPLGFGQYHLLLTPRGNMYLGGGSYMRPRDFVKLGQVYLSGGVWNGRRIISKEWVDESLRPRTAMQDTDDYGYGWHLMDYRVGERTYRASYASGNGGQLLIIVPELEIVVMFTAGNYANYPTWWRFRDELVPQYILAAAG